jgi:hypothetical protein
MRRDFGSRIEKVCVGWNEATAFCDWLTQSGLLPPGFVACLPTECQWEYACRAGSDTEYYKGDGEASLAEVGWYAENSGNETKPVDEKMEEHPFGLFGMHGNVLEWCRDSWDEDAYKKRVDGVAESLTAPASKGPVRVLRGGSWGLTAGDCRAAFRNWNGPDGRNWNVGFRVCLVPGPSAEPERGAREQEGEESERVPGDGGRRPESNGMRGDAAELDFAKKKKPAQRAKYFFEMTIG